MLTMVSYEFVNIVLIGFRPRTYCAVGYVAVYHSFLHHIKLFENHLAPFEPNFNSESCNSL